MGFLQCLLRTALAAVGAAIVACSFLAGSSVLAQERGSLERRVRSPEVSDDHKVTFRLQAPNAKSVLVTGDFTGKAIEMTRDADGVWAFTTEPLKPSSYQYWFIMDGLTMPDRSTPTSGQPPASTRARWRSRAKGPSSWRSAMYPTAC